jgi:hypothetical protein
MATPLIATLIACGCGASEESSSEEAPPIDPASVPVPPADGPKLLATRHEVVVRERPAPGAKPLGTLRLGATVARSEAALTSQGCPAGWYAVRPRGFVCAGEEATVDLAHPAARLKPPTLAHPLPYRYARVAEGGTITYGALPTAAEQAAAEPKRKNSKAMADRRLGAGANDVPLDDGFRPTGPAVVMPDADDVGPDGYRTRSTFFALDGFSGLEVGASLVGTSETRVLKRSSGVALAGIFDHDGRTFGVTLPGRIVPIDHLVVALGTTWHGIDATKATLPVGFALRQGVNAYDVDKTATRLDEEFGTHEAIALSGRFRTINGEKYFHAESGVWVRHRDLILIPKRHDFPDFASGDQKWIDISLANQTLVAWEGRKPVLATLISSGQDRLGDPEKGPATAQGVFRLRKKAIAADLDAQETHQAHSVESAPWVMEFSEGFSLVGCYWHNRFGESVGHHDVAVSPIDAHQLFAWTSPEVPEGWHAVEIGEDEGTIVYVHK